MKAINLSRENLSGKAFYIEGDDTYWRSFAVDFFASLIPQDERAFNLKIIESMSSMEEIREAAETSPMFGGLTVVIVKDSKYKESEAEKQVFTEVIKSLDNAYLVFDAVSFLTPRHKKLMTEIDAARLEAYEIKKLISSKYKLTSSAADRLIEYAVRDMARITTEAEKLTAYKQGKTITAEDVEALVANSAENAIYDFANALASQKKGEALAILDGFIKSGTPYSYILSTLVSQYRRMLHSALSPKTPAEVAEFLGTKPYAIQKAREAAKKYTRVQLKTCLDALVQAELSFKSGEVPEDTAFKAVLSKLITI